MAIDALKDDIRGILKSTKQLNQELKDLDEFMEKRKVQTSDYLQKREDGKCHKLELYRDLATFEFNFSKRNNKAAFTLIDSMTERIDEFKRDLDSLNKKSGEGAKSWLTEKQASELSHEFTLISINNQE